MRLESEQRFSVGSASLGRAVPRVAGEWVAETEWRSSREGSAAFGVGAGPGQGMDSWVTMEALHRGQS